LLALFAKEKQLDKIKVFVNKKLVGKSHCAHVMECMMWQMN
jgi:hypothetical protein